VAARLSRPTVSRIRPSERFIGMERTDAPPPFQVFFDQHRALVHRFLVASVGPVDADDCFQETFLSALRAYPSLRHSGNLRAWVLAIAANKAVDAGRARARRAAPIGDVPDNAGMADGGTEPIDPSDPLWSAVRALPERMRTAVVLRHMLDRSYEEVAAVMGGTEEAARANVHQGLKRLRDAMREPVAAAREE
jgi:RNA polymerase sigma factor (sigma-70 family)